MFPAQFLLRFTHISSHFDPPAEDIVDKGFEQFLRERQYLSNVGARTIEWHKQSLKWLQTETPIDDDLKACVIRMREAGLSASSCNCRAGSINAYMKWRGSPLKIPKMRESIPVLPTYTVDDIRKFAAWKLGTDYDMRLQALILLLADSGLRIGEALALRWADVDFRSLLLTESCAGLLVETRDNADPLVRPS
jgi:integrase/recombinase XerD